VTQWDFGRCVSLLEEVGGNMQTLAAEMDGEGLAGLDAVVTRDRVMAAERALTTVKRLLDRERASRR
jgi:hypothetical protein